MVNDDTRNKSVVFSPKKFQWRIWSLIYEEFYAVCHNKYVSLSLASDGSFPNKIDSVDSNQFKGN